MNILVHIYHHTTFKIIQTSSQSKSNNFVHYTPVTLCHVFIYPVVSFTVITLFSLFFAAKQMFLIQEEVTLIIGVKEVEEL